MKTNSMPEVLTLKAIVGAAYVSITDAISQVDASGVSSGDFVEPGANAAFGAILAAMRMGRFPDTLSLISACGVNADRELIADVMSNWEPGKAPERLAVLREMGRRRALISSLRSLWALATSDASYASALGESLRVLGALEEPASELRTLDSELIGLVDEVEAIYDGRAATTLRTGIEALDNVIGGLQPTLTILGAEPGAGKSALMARIIRNIAERGTKVGVFSLEDQSRWLVRRMVSETSRVPVFVLQNRKLTEHQRDAFGTGADKVHELARNVVVEDRKGLGSKDIVAMARVMVARHGVKAIFIDHLGEIRMQRTERHDRDIGDVLRELRGIADMHRVPIVVLCHVRRREGVGEEPRLTDFAFSADVERTARVALALVKPDEARQGIHVLKQTSGQAGMAVWLDFDGPSAMSTNRETVKP